MAGTFHSTGAAMTNALAQIIAERQAKQRQDLMDSLLVQGQQSQMQDRLMNRQIQEKALAGDSEDRRLRGEQIAMQLAGQKLSQGKMVADTVRAGSPMTPELQEALGPLALSMTQTTGGFVPGGEGPTELKTFTGTEESAQFDQAQGMKHALALIADEAKKRADATDRTALENRIKDVEERARQANENIGIREGHLRVAQDKLATGENEKADEKAMGEATRKEALTKSLELIDAMDKHPGMGAATGAFEVLGHITQPAQDFKSIRDQLTAVLAIPNLPSLKGPLSDKDIAFIKQSVTRIANSRISEQAMRQELRTLKAGIMQKLNGASGVAGANSASGTTVTPTAGKPTATDLINKYRRK